MDYLFSFVEEDIRQKKTESKLDRKTSLYKALDNRNTFKININSFINPITTQDISHQIDSKIKAIILVIFINALRFN